MLTIVHGYYKQWPHAQAFECNDSGAKKTFALYPLGLVPPNYPVPALPVTVTLSIPVTISSRNRKTSVYATGVMCISKFK
jgi:hypothetical protein